MYVMRQFAWLVALAGIALLTACGSGGSGGGSQSGATYPTTSLHVTVGGGSMQTSNLKFSPNVFLGAFADVTSVTVVVSGPDAFGVFQNPLASVSLTQGPSGAWEGTIANLPVGPTLTFTARGYNASHAEIFNGVLTQALTGSGDALAIAMSPVDDGTPIAFPIITGISLPSEIVVGSSAAVNVGVIGSPSATLSYAFTSGGGGFAPGGGSIGLPSSGTGAVGTTYTAPLTVDTYPQTVRVTNSQGNAVEADFPAVVVHDLMSPVVQTLFAPTVTALLGKRTGNNVTWTATVQDDKDIGLLTFAWNFTQSGGTAGASFSTADVNPGVMSGYDQSVKGTVALTIADADGLSTTVSFTLVAGQFPDGSVFPSDLDVLLQTDSGTPMAAEGTWVGCQAGNNLREEHVFSGATLGVNTYAGTSGSTCAGGTLDPAQSGAFNIAAVSAVAIQGWIDGTGTPAAAPARASGAGTLSNTPTATVLSISGSFGGALVSGTLTVFVDDSAATPKLWRSSSSGNCPTVSGVEVCLTTVDPLYLDGAVPSPAVVKAAGGQSFSLAIQGDGTLWAWGTNVWGQLGNGTSGTGATAFAPVQVGTDANWATVAAGANSAHAVRSDGTLWAWGFNNSGQLGNGSTGSVNATPVQIGTDASWAAVSAGVEFSLGLKTDGTLWATGKNTNGQLGDGTTTGRQTYAQVGSSANWAAVSAGYTHALAIRTDGTLWAWGNNGSGQIGDGTTGVDRPTPIQLGTASDWSAISAGHHHNLGIRSDGTLWAWGSNAVGELGDGTTTDRPIPTQVGSDTHWVAVAVGYDHSHALRSDGTLWSWGGNSSGYLGDGTFASRLTPVRVGSATIRWSTVAASTSSLLAITDQGALRVAGFNTFGAVGDGTSVTRPSPALPAWP